jgi:hypothetical protein
MFRERPVPMGVALAGMIGMVIALSVEALAPSWVLPTGFVGMASLPVAVLLAWRHSTDVAAMPHFPNRRVLLIVLQAVLLGSLTATVAWTAMLAVAPPPSGTSALEVASSVALVLQVVYVACIGVVFFGLPAYLVIFPIVVVWAALLRRIVRPLGVAT